MEILNFKGPLSDLIHILKKGGSIHIKKKNRGKFTEYCGGKVTEECIAKGKKSKDPKIRKRATFAANARKWKHENGGVISKYHEGGPNYWDNSYFKFNDGNKSKEEELYEKTVPEIPYRPINYSHYPQWNIFAHGLKNINQEIKDNSIDLYFNTNATYYKDKDNNYYMFNHTEDSGVINPENFEEVPYSEIRGKLAARDYIGGDKRDVGIKVIEKIPDLKETIIKLSDLYNISKDVFTQRLINEGWLQQIARNYNTVGPNEQKNFDWNSIMNDPVYGQSQLGLDTFGDYFKAGKLNLRRNINFEDVFGQNEDKTGKEYNSANFKNAYDALEAKAAVFEYFTKLAKERNIPEADIDAYVNAMYNMGPYHNDLNNMDYVRRTYSVTPYFKLGGILKAQKGTENLLTPHPLSPIDIALNQAKAIAKMKRERQYLPLGVKEVIGPDGKKVAIRTEQPLQPMGQEVAAWLPGVGDVVEVGQIANDVKNGNFGTAALAAGLMVLPGNARKILDKFGVDLGDISTFARLSDQEWDDMYFQAIESGDNDLVQHIRDAHFKVKAPDTKAVNPEGNPIRLFHGEKDSPTYHDLRYLNSGPDHKGLGVYYSSSSKDIAETYAQHKGGPTGQVREVYYNIKNPNVVDAEGRSFQTVLIEEGSNGAKTGVSTDQLVNRTYWEKTPEGYNRKSDKDGLIIQNVEDHAPGWTGSSEDAIADNYVTWNPYAVKSAEAIVRHPQTGEIIPISKRDNFNIPSILMGSAPMILGLGVAKTVSNNNNTKGQQ